MVVLIVWVYYSGQIFFLGAEFTKTFTMAYGSQPNGETDAPTIREATNSLKSADTPRIITPSPGAGSAVDRIAPIEQR